MAAAEIIRGIGNLPADEQASVIRFACRLDAQRKLTGKELSALATRMVEADDPAEALMLREEIIRGFYGGKPDA